MAFPFDITEHTIPASHIREYPRATASSQDAPLLLHVKQYIPRTTTAPQPADGAVTIIGAHANGFPKEMYEPLWEDIYHEFGKKGMRIRSILIADCTWQARSGFLNQSNLGNDPSWLDAARDIAHMVNTFRPPRPLLALGHSLGSIVLLSAALSHPRLFTSMILIEPVYYGHDRVDHSTGKASLRRRESWPSRAAARDILLKNPYYASWDARVMDRWLEFGLIDDKHGENGETGVKLATSKHQELVTYVRPTWPAFDPSGTTLLSKKLLPDLDPPAGFNANDLPFYRPEMIPVYGNIGSVRPPVLYILGARSDVPNRDRIAEYIHLTGSGRGGSGGVREGCVRKIVDEEAGHLVAMQKPGLCAGEAAAWWEMGLERWRVEEREFEEWKAQPGEKSVTGEEFQRRLREIPRSKPRL